MTGFLSRPIHNQSTGAEKTLTRDDYSEIGSLLEKLKGNLRGLGIFILSTFRF
jgi:hypothetical protein